MRCVLTRESRWHSPIRRCPSSSAPTGGICELWFVFRIRNEKHVVEAVQSAWRINGEAPHPTTALIVIAI